MPFTELTLGEAETSVPRDERHDPPSDFYQKQLARSMALPCAPFHVFVVGKLSLGQDQFLTPQLR